ncbi:MAG: hypothetical protein IT410_04065 [Candidatus Doudnabacteria bacterium]|nr:hypothetical protein [Candidatus Doudnabacteria bacterium]
MDINSLLDQIIHNTILNFWAIIKTSWSSLWPYVLGLAVLILGGIILQIIMLRSGSHNKLSAGFNSLVGSLFWFIFFAILLGIAYVVFGPQVIDEIWFGLLSMIAFFLAGGFLRLIGFWYY